MPAKSAVIREILAQRKLAVVGVSRSKNKFGNAAYRSLRAAGFRVFAVNPEADRIEGDPCYRDLASLPEPVGAVVAVVPPAVTEKLVAEAAAAGINYVWMQQGAESAEAIAACERAGIRYVSGECILMFAEPTPWFHRAHRFVRKVTRGLPA
jgi:predicted CoA-binding protein